MRTIKIIIERSKDFFWAYSEGEGVLISGGGDTVAACKQGVMDCIETLKEIDGKNKLNFADGAYKLVFKFDTQSLMEYYKGIFTNAAFERLTGINQMQMSHYATGLKKPRPAQAKKIEGALHKLGNELLAIEL